MRVIERTMFYGASPNTFDKELAIEIDGEIHLKKEVNEYDDGRSYDIEKLGIKILRFTNNEVFTDLEKIIEEILKTIAVLEPPLGGRG